MNEAKSETKETVFTIPNIFSVLRILLVPFFLLMMFQRRPAEALIIFLFASFTDFLDGITARVWRQKTRIGSYLDPAADKLLMSSAFISLSLPSLGNPNVIPLWLTFSAIGRDILIVTSAFILYITLKQRTFNPSLIGKTCVVSQMIVLTLVLFYNATASSSPLLNWLYLFTLFLIILSSIFYAISEVRIIFSPGNRRPL